MIDWGRIDELRTEVGDDDFAEIALLFMSEIEEAIEGLAALADLAARSDALHGMKGSAMNLGFADFAKLCAQGEKDPDMVDMPHLAKALSAAVAAVRQRFPELS